MIFAYPVIIRWRHTAWQVDTYIWRGIDLILRQMVIFRNGFGDGSLVFSAKSSSGAVPKETEGANFHHGKKGASHRERSRKAGVGYRGGFQGSGTGRRLRAASRGKNVPHTRVLEKSRQKSLIRLRPTCDRRSVFSVED